MKYGGYYPEGAEKLAHERDELRKQGRFQEADILRLKIAWEYGVEVLDSPTGYALQWQNGWSPVNIRIV